MSNATSALPQWLGSSRFRLIDLARGTDTLGRLTELESIQFESARDIKRRQNNLLDRYVDLVRTSSPLYRGYTDFSQFPVIDKTFAIENRDYLLNPHYKGKLIRKKTSGSSGQPFVYLTGADSQSYLWAGILLSWRVTGYRPGEPVAFLGGPSFSGPAYVQRIYYKLLNVQLFSVFHMSTDKMRAYAEAIDRGRFRLLYGYASAIHLFALHLLTTPAKHRFALRAVVCTAEPLTASMRETIEEAFGVPCFNQYGCNDAGVLAYECEHREGFHLVTTRSYPEVLDDGRFISTDLSNDAFFLPRYATGDLVRMSGRKCRCGRGFPLIDEVLGRTTDLVSDDAGNVVHASFFTNLLVQDRRIMAFQVVFDASRLVVVIHCRDAGTGWNGYIDRIRALLAFDPVEVRENVPFVKSRNGKHAIVLRVEDVQASLAEAARQRAE
ncbi:MAG TPA: hypothetical protein VGE12_14375 [Noviherbaspirillum sp.]